MKIRQSRKNSRTTRWNLKRKNQAKKWREEMIAKFGALFLFNRWMHQFILENGSSTLGHGADHDDSVSQLCGFVAPSKRVAEMAWCVAMMHSIDRHFDPKMAVALIEDGLSMIADQFSLDEIDRIRAAVFGHSERNNPRANSVTKTVQDADKIANIGALNIVRCGQHHHDIPACIMETLGLLNPASTFKKPASCYDATFYNLEWKKMLWFPKSRALALTRRRFDYTAAWQRQVVKEFREIGL